MALTLFLLLYCGFSSGYSLCVRRLRLLASALGKHVNEVYKNIWSYLHRPVIDTQCC